MNTSGKLSINGLKQLDDIVDAGIKLAESSMDLIVDEWKDRYSNAIFQKYESSEAPVEAAEVLGIAEAQASKPSDFLLLDYYYEMYTRHSKLKSIK